MADYYLYPERVLEGIRTDAPHSVPVVFVVDAIADCVHLVPERVQRTPVRLDVEVPERVEQADAEHHDVQAEHPVVVLGAGSSLHESQEVRDVVGELRVGGWRAVVVVDGAIIDWLGEEGLLASCR